MEIRSKWNLFIEKLSQKSFKINATIFATLWIIYIVASFYLTLWFGTGGWSTLATVPASFLFYTIICALVLAKLIIYFFKKNRSITFYPLIFIFLVLMPQLLFVLFNTLRDCGDSYCATNPNLMAAILGGHFKTLLSLFSPFVSIVSVIVYITGLILLFYKVFRSESIPIPQPFDNNPLKTFPKKLGSFALFCLFFVIIMAAAITFAMIQSGSFKNLCPLIISQYNRDFCYREAGTIKKDSAYCAKASNNQLERDICYEEVGSASHDPSVCDTIATETGSYHLRSRCYENVAVFKNDLALCGKIEYNDSKALCYEEIGIARSDLGICDMINVDDYQTKYKKGTCYAKVAAVKQDLHICERIEDEDAKDDCYSGIGATRNDLAVCDKVIDSTTKDRCYADVAIFRKDLSLCDQINYNKDGCYAGVGIAKQDLTICEEIMYTWPKTDCYTGIAVAQKDLSICDKLKTDDSSDNESCYAEVSVATHDLAICDKIKDGYYKDQCKKGISKNQTK